MTEGSRDLGIDGLLDLVQSNQTSGGLQNPISSAIAMKKWTCSRMTIFDINIYPLSLLPDSCRAYQAVKCLVTASSKCPSVRKVPKCFPQFRRKVIKKCPRICGGFQIFSLCVKYPKLCSSSSAPVPSLQVRDHLILQPTKWQWAVNWLKSKMTESSSYWSPVSDSVMMHTLYLSFFYTGKIFGE